MKYFDLSSCPPGFEKISNGVNELCYQIEEPSPWNYPCFASGGASIITDLNTMEIDYLIKSLEATNTSRFFWLPAKRQKLFNPVVWFIPGPNWGRQVSFITDLELKTCFLKDCALLDIKKRKIVTETCSKSYPSVCFYINNLNNPATCPEGYSALRFTPDTGTCYGIEHSISGLTYGDFLKNHCKTPMTDYKYNALSRFLFKKIAQLNNLPTDTWCWFNTTFANSISNGLSNYNNETILVVNELTFSALKGMINNAGSLGLQNSTALLSCMACETNVTYIEPELMFEYNGIERKIYITIYYPSYLWKYNENDKGIQCFSDDKGFVRVIDINDAPYINVTYTKEDTEKMNNYNIEKIVYSIDIVTDRSAQYWCEGHTTNFSFISTDKIIINPQGYEVHVFSLILNHYISYDIGETPLMTDLLLNLTKFFGAKKILLMDIFEYSLGYMLMLLHVHITVDNIYEDDGLNIRYTYNELKEKAEQGLHQYNSTLVNMSSSVYCLPTTTINTVVLDWELTPIGYISAPKQFCLQANGLPVKRRCHGSYHLGSYWGSVQGICASTYKPSDATTFLYNFIKGKISNNYTTRFLTDGLEFVLGDIDIIIPADIFYLSVSLQQILYMTQVNDTSIEMGDVDNIAWIMDRIMTLDSDYLRLAQSLNSTNVIVNSVNDIIEIIVQKYVSYQIKVANPYYQLAVKPKYVLQVSHPEYNNITGIAISRKNDIAIDSMNEMIIEPLYENTTLDDVLSIKNLEIATWIPLELLESLKVYTNESKDVEVKREDVHITISVFQNDAVFQELIAHKHSVNSRILGIAIPGFISNLQYPVPLVFRSFIHNINQSFCGYWDFQAKNPEYLTGLWRKNGCFVVKTENNITVCECYHLTHFGHLLRMPIYEYNDEPSIEVHHVNALNIITLVGSFLSLIGITGIWITALVFANWRKKAGTKVLLQLSSAIALPLVFIVIFNLDTRIFVEENGNYTVPENMKILCVILGALLHYSILSSFMWMLITAILQFIRYVQVLGVRRPSRFMVKFTIIGWGIPTIPVAILLAINTDNYVPNTAYSKTICYPQGFYMIVGILVPIGIILIINISLFLLVLHSISRGPKGHMKITDIDLVKAQLRLSVFLFFLLGLTWIFGIFSFTNNLLWSYLFCLTSTMQGFVLFIYFVICDPSTRNLWVTLMKPQFRRNPSRSSISSLGTG